MKVTKIIPVTPSKFDLSAKKKNQALKLYVVTINWYGENINFHTKSTTEKRALHNAMRRLGKKLQISFYSVRIYVLNSQKDRWKVKEVKG